MTTTSADQPGVADSRTSSALLWTRAALVIVAIGAAVRVELFLSRRSLWLDEALLANNIVRRSYLDLLEPLSGNQGAPPVFLWLERSTVLALGNNEYALRAVPLVAGLGVLLVSWLLARRFLSPAAAAVATMVVATSPMLVRYSVEVKQYSTDALVAATVILLAVRLSDSWTLPRLAWLAGVGAVALWLAHPAVFVVSGVGLVLLVHALRRRDPQVLLTLSAVGVLWASSFMALYLVSLRDLNDNEQLTDYWRSGFLPRPIEVGASIRWTWQATSDVLVDVVGLGWAWLAAPLLAAGLVRLVRRYGLRAMLLVSPAPALIVAASAEKYPASGRLVLFLVPLVAILVVAPFDRRPRLHPAVGLVAIALVTAPMVRDFVDLMVDPPRFADAREVLEHVREHRRTGDRIWVHDLTTAPASYYGPILGLEVDAVTRWAGPERCDRDGLAGELVDVPATDASARVWIVFAYTLSTRPANEAALVRSKFDDRGRRLDLVEAADAFAALYDLSLSPDRASPSASAERFACLRVVPQVHG